VSQVESGLLTRREYYEYRQPPPKTNTTHPQPTHHPQPKKHNPPQPTNPTPHPPTPTPTPQPNHPPPPPPPHPHTPPPPTPPPHPQTPPHTPLGGFVQLPMACHPSSTMSIQSFPGNGLRQFYILQQPILARVIPPLTGIRSILAKTNVSQHHGNNSTNRRIFFFTFTA